MVNICHPSSLEKFASGQYESPNCDLKTWKKSMGGFMDFFISCSEARGGTELNSFEKCRRWKTKKITASTIYYSQPWNSFFRELLTVFSSNISRALPFYTKGLGLNGSTFNPFSLILRWVLIFQMGLNISITKDLMSKDRLEIIKATLMYRRPWKNGW